VKLVAGLGNPGKKYEKTRHNAGFMAVDRFVAKLAADRGEKPPAYKRKYLACFTSGRLHTGEDVAIIKPRTFMNRSGRSVARAVKKLDVNPAEMVVVHDDLDLPLGKIRIKSGGGTGGHKGLESICGALGTRDYIRLRIGIDRPPRGESVTGYVLEEFTPSELVIFRNEVLPVAVDALFAIFTRSLEEAMNAFN